MTTTRELTYRAYLLRLWRDREAAPWRAGLEDTQTGERRNFADLEKLFTFLNEQTEVVGLPDPEQEASPL